MTTRPIRIVTLDPTTGIASVREHHAATVYEALQTARELRAGMAPQVFGITADDYAAARAEGIACNEADGLLVDPSAPTVSVLDVVAEIWNDYLEPDVQMLDASSVCGALIVEACQRADALIAAMADEPRLHPEVRETVSAYANVVFYG